MRISVLQHAAGEGPGEIGNWAATYGHPLRICHLDRGDPLPDSFDLLVVMGGEMNIYQDDAYPWLKAERRFIRDALEAGKKMVGMCLGAQLLADALGSRVRQNLEWEIGWFPIRFTPEGREKFPMLPESALALHWHEDTFTLPEGATRLGVSEACGEQGFVIPGKCLGLQFHLEMNVPLVKQFVEGSSDFSKWPKGKFVQSPKTILEEAEKHGSENRRLLFALLDGFCGKD